MPEVLDPRKLPNLPEESEDDPLSQMGYEPSTNAERQQEIADDELDGTSDQSLTDDYQEIKDAYQDVKQAGQELKAARAGKAVATGEKATGAGAGEKTLGGAVAYKVLSKRAPKGSWMRGVQRKILQGRMKVKAAQRAALTTARQAAARMAVRRGVAGATGRLVAALLSEAMIPVIGWIMAALTALWVLFKTKLGKWILIGLMILMMLPGIFFIMSFGAIGAVLTPSSPAEKAQATQAMALSGDPGAKREVIINSAESMKKKLGDLKNLATKKYDAGKATAAKQSIDTLITKLDQLIKAPDNAVERKKLFDQINADLKTLSATYPELLISAGNCGDLQKFVDEKKFSDPRANRMLDIKSLPKGTLHRNDGAQIPANPKLCNVLVFILSNGFSLGSATIANGHKKMTASGHVSQHWVGEAIDLAMINGVGSPGSARWQSETKRLQKLLQDNAGPLGIYELWGPHNTSIDNCKPTTRRIGGHNDHIHLGVTNDQNIKRCR